VTTHINLRDWRQERRKKRKERFAASMGLGVLVAAVVVGIAYMAVDSQLNNQNARNTYLRQQIKEIQELERVRSNLLARMRVIESLQASRSAGVHFFDEIVNTLPEGVNITSLKQAGPMVTIDGVADSNGRISTYMKNLDASIWFENPRLVVIKSNEKDRRRKSEFQLQVKTLTKPKSATGTADSDDSEQGVIE
jgi:type IV pilus assembly protein PilN